jgi:CheY-like chemotaxis protein
MRVLLAEDDVIVARDTAFMLKSVAAVDVAATGEEALELISRPHRRHAAPGPDHRGDA